MNDRRFKDEKGKVVELRGRSVDGRTKKGRRWKDQEEGKNGLLWFDKRVLELYFL